MKKKLAEIFKGKCVAGVIPDDANRYFWFFDEKERPIGISKEISRSELELIRLSYRSMGVDELADPQKSIWRSFLTANGASGSVPEVKNDVTLVSFIFFYHDFDLNLEQAFESLVKSFRHDFKVIFLEKKYGVILDFSTGKMEEDAEICDFLLASKQDFSTHLIFYRTIYYEIDVQLPRQFKDEWLLFESYKDESVDLMRYTDVFLNHMVSNEAMEGYLVFRDWFKSLFEIDPELLSVVKCYLETGFNVTTGAKMLHMHRNTFMNKLDRFILETGLDVKKFDEAAIAYLWMKGLGRTCK